MFPISDLPPYIPDAEVRLYCSVEAGIHYGIPADLIYAVSLTEGGTAGQKVKNKNGTYDIGYMQFNNSYLNTLKKEGITTDDVSKHNCYPFHLAGWRIKGHLSESGSDLLQKVAYYHSRTESYNMIYRNKLAVNIRKFPREQAIKYFEQIISQLNNYFKNQPLLIEKLAQIQ